MSRFVYYSIGCAHTFCPPPWDMPHSMEAKSPRRFPLAEAENAVRASSKDAIRGSFTSFIHSSPLGRPARMAITFWWLEDRMGRVVLWKFENGVSLPETRGSRSLPPVPADIFKSQEIFDVYTLPILTRGPLGFT